MKKKILLKEIEDLNTSNKHLLEVKREVEEFIEDTASTLSSISELLLALSVRQIDAEYYVRAFANSNNNRNFFKI